MIMIGTLIMAVEKIDENRCYNLPLNDFYRDKSCLKYKEGVIR